MIFFTDNITSTDPAEAGVLKQISMSATAGQPSLLTTFRIANTFDTPQEIMIHTPDINVQLSFEQTRAFEPALNYTVNGQSVGDTVFVRVLPDLSALEGEVESAIFADNIILPLKITFSEVYSGDRMPALEIWKRGLDDFHGKLDPAERTLFERFSGQKPST